MRDNVNQILMNKMLDRQRVWFEEFMQLRYDDKDFSNQYSENEFHQWCEDYNLI